MGWFGSYSVGISVRFFYCFTYGLRLTGFVDVGYCLGTWFKFKFIFFVDNIEFSFEFILAKDNFFLSMTWGFTAIGPA